LTITSGSIIAESFDAGLGNVVIDGSAGTVAATTFIGDLTGTASYATQALSASYAPSAGGPSISIYWQLQSLRVH
jgi:hypothetical protein